MERRFAGNSWSTLVAAGFFALPALAFGASGSFIGLMLFGAVAVTMLLQYAYNYRQYVITDKEFYIADINGNKIDSVLFEDVVKLYTLKGYKDYSPLGMGDVDSYEASILKIQLKNGSVFRLDLDRVLYATDLLNALQEKAAQQLPQ